MFLRHDWTLHKLTIAQTLAHTGVGRVDIATALCTLFITGVGVAGAAVL